MLVGLLLLEAAFGLVLAVVAAWWAQTRLRDRSDHDEPGGHATRWPNSRHGRGVPRAAGFVSRGGGLFAQARRVSCPGATASQTPRVQRAGPRGRPRYRSQRGAWVVPDGIPLLDRGGHARPQDGGCVMEIVSLLAGEAWSDQPACTHPLLAAAARMVNDTVDADTRQRLWPLVLRLVGADQRHPRLTAELTITIANHALRHRSDDRAAQRALRRAHRRRDRATMGHALVRAWLQASDHPLAGHTRMVLLARVVAVAATSSAREPLAVLTELLDTYERTTVQLVTAQDSNRPAETRAGSSAGRRHR